MTFPTYLSITISLLLGVVVLQSWFSLGVMAKVGLCVASLGLLSSGLLMLGKHDPAQIMKAEMLSKWGLGVALVGVILRASGWFGLGRPRRRREDWQT